MKKIGIIILVLVLTLCLVGCSNSNGRTFTIDKTFNLLDKPITEFPYYNMVTNEEYEITLNNREEYNRQYDEIKKKGIEDGDYELFEEFYLQIDFDDMADSSGFLGIKDFNMSNITVYFEYDYESSDDDSETKITDICFRFKEEVDEEYINKIMCTYFEDNEEDFVRAESESADYKYVFKYNEDKYVTFGETSFFWEYSIGFHT